MNNDTNGLHDPGAFKIRDGGLGGDSIAFIFSGPLFGPLFGPVFGPVFVLLNQD